MFGFKLERRPQIKQIWSFSATRSCYVGRGGETQLQVTVGENYKIT